MSEGDIDLAFEMALAMREVRLYWRTGREPLTLEDKLQLAEAILAGLKRSHVTLAVVRDPPIHRGRVRGSSCASAVSYG